LVTAPLTRGDILAGVTRDSILELTRGWLQDKGPGAGQIKSMSVSERWLTMGEVVEAQKEGRVSILWLML
jgi:branched-chain amino acid aminotransferase